METEPWHETHEASCSMTAILGSRFSLMFTSIADYCAIKRVQVTFSGCQISAESRGGKWHFLLLQFEIDVSFRLCVCVFFWLLKFQVNLFRVRAFEIIANENIIWSLKDISTVWNSRFKSNWMLQVMSIAQCCWNSIDFQETNTVRIARTLPCIRNQF